MVYMYDTTQGLLATALHFSKTVTPDVLASFEFWLFLALHLAVFSLRGFMTEDLLGALGINWESVNIVTGITTFFEVFYTNQCYSRYVKLHGMCKDSFTTAHEIYHFLGVYSTEAGHSYARMSARYVLVSMSLLMGVLKGLPVEVSLDDMAKKGLLEGAEREALESCNKTPWAPITVATVWASNAAGEALEVSGSNSVAFRPFLDRMLRLQGLMKGIADICDLPIPFQYFHLLATMVIMNLLVWAVVLGLSGTLFAPLIYCFASYIFIGMMELSSAMSDPFGEDEVDFPVAKWLDSAWELSKHVVELELPGNELAMAHWAATEPRMSQGGDLRKLIREKFDQP